jgi:hypothetical protein
MRTSRQQPCHQLLTPAIPPQAGARSTENSSPAPLKVEPDKGERRGPLGLTGPPRHLAGPRRLRPLHPPRHRGGRDRLGSRDQRPARRRAAQFGRAQSPAPVGQPRRPGTRQPRRRDHRHRYQKRRPAGQNGSPRLRSPAVPPLAAERDPWRAGRRPHGTFQDEPGTTRPGKYATVEYAIVPAPGRSASTRKPNVSPASRVFPVLGRDHRVPGYDPFPRHDQLEAGVTRPGRAAVAEPPSLSECGCDPAG